MVLTIVTMKFESEVLGNHLDISSNYHTNNKKVILKQIKTYRTDFYKCADGKFRFVTIYFKDVSFNRTKGTYVIDRKWYDGEKEKKRIKIQIQNSYISMHRDELLGVVKEQGQPYFYDVYDEVADKKRLHDGVNPEILLFALTGDDKKRCD